MQIRRKPKPGQGAGSQAGSLYAARLGAVDPGHYRSTPPGAPNVVALIRPGMLVRTSYGTGGIVTAVDGPYVHIGPSGREYPHFTIVYVPADRYGRHTDRDLRWLNECVAVHGRILMLLEANTDEVFVEEHPSGLR